MTQRTRYFLFGSSLVLVVALCTGLVAYYNGSMPMRASSVGPAELAYVPDGTTAVAYANVHDVMNSQFRQKLRQAFPTGEEKDKIQQEIGVDIEHDIDTVVAGFRGTTADEKNAIVLVRGRFNTQQIQDVAVQHGGTVEKYGNKPLIVMPDHGDMKGDGAAVAVLESGLLALGSTTSVKQAIDAGANGQNVTKNADLMKYVGELQGQNTAWAVGQIGALANDANVPQQARDQIANIQWAMINLHVDGGVNGVARAIAKDDQAAENLRDVVRGGLAAARMMAGQDARITAVMNSVQVSGTGKDVAVSFVVPNEMLDMLNGVAALGRLSGGAIKK
jgi:predicted protein tyrosine phosphatase